MLALLLEVALLPEAAGATVVVVAGDHQHRQLQGPDGAAGGRDIGAGGLVGIEQITRHQDEGGPLLTRHLAEAADGAEPLLAQPGALVGIADPGVGLAELPVGGVEETEHG